MIPRFALLLIGAVFLMIDDDQPQPGKRGEDCEACAHDHPHLTGENPPPVSPSLVFRHVPGQQRDLRAGMPGHPRGHPLRLGDLGNQHNRPEIPLHRPSQGFRVGIEPGVFAHDRHTPGSCTQLRHHTGWRGGFGDWAGRLNRAARISLGFAQGRGQ